MKDTISASIDQLKSLKSSLGQRPVSKVLKNSVILTNPNSMPPLEKEIIDQLQAGDSQAFSNIFNAYYRDLVIFAARFTKKLNQAEEIVQDTFVTLWEDYIRILFEW